MSWEATTWALKDAPTDEPMEVLVLVGLSNHAHGDGSNAWISNRNLAAYCRCSIRTIQTHIAALEAKGLIRRGDQDYIPDKVPLNRRPIVWDLALERTRSGVQNLHATDVRGADSGAQGCSKPAAGVQLSADKLNTNQEINQRRKIPISRDERLLASLRAEQPRPAPDCPHGVKPWRCPQC